MSKRWLAPIASASLAAVGAFGLSMLLTAGPAQAHDTPSAPYDAVLHEPHHNSKAKAYTKGCTEVGQIGSDKDGWVFNIAPDEFVLSVGMWATFDTGSGTDKVYIHDGSNGSMPPATGYPHGFANATNKHLAWVVVPAGWTLLDAEAKSDDDNNIVRVTHTCPGTPTTPTPTPPVETPTPTPPVETPTPTPPVETPTPTPTGVVETTPPGTDPTTPGPVTTTPGGGLPKTGVAIGGFVVAGLGLIAGGVAMMFIRRRREMTELAE